MISKQKSRYASECVFLLFVVGLFVCFFPIGLDAHHDGYLFNMALNIRRGGTIYVDYANIYGPLTAYTHSLFMGVFGDTILAMRISALPFLLASFALYYRIFIRWLPHWYVLFSQVLLLLIGTGFNSGWSSIYALLFVLLAAESMLKYLETSRILCFILSAVFATITFLYRQPVGVCIILAGLCSVIYLGITRERKWQEAIKLVLLYLASVVISMLPILVFFFFKGCIVNWWYHNVLVLFNSNALTGLRQESIDLIKGIVQRKSLSAFGGENSFLQKYLPNYVDRIISTPVFGKIFKLIICLFPIYPFNSQIIWLVLPVVSIATFFSIFIELTNNKDLTDRRDKIKIGILAIYALAAWGQYYPSGNHLHWYYSCFPMYGILMLNIWKFGQRIKYGNVRGGGGYVVRNPVDIGWAGLLFFIFCV